MLKRQGMKKSYILDTNVLLHDPNAFMHFDDNHVIIPLKVIEEIDTFKRDLSELGRNARHLSRTLDGLRRQGKLADGVPLPNGGLLRVTYPAGVDPFDGRLPADDQILQVALELMRVEHGQPCIIVSKDINLRLKADALNISAEDYQSDHVDIAELYEGHREAEVTPEQLAAFQRDGRLPFEPADISPNEYVMLRAGGGDGPAQSALGRFDVEHRCLVPLAPVPEEAHPIQPRNREQYYALDALLNDQIKVVTVIGKAGTGKTLLAIAAALHKTFDKKNYRRMLVCRPTFPMGRDIGFLPGTVEEKLNPWMQPIYDALDLLANGKRPGLRRTKEGYEESDRIGIEPLTYIRGRSLPNQFIVVDEAQNLTPHEAKTVMTRVGHGTKIVLTGDIYQIDNPYVDSMSNGLSTVVERFRDHPIAAHVLLTKGVRSEVAELAANLL